MKILGSKTPTVPCRLCSSPTPMLGTKLCDRCWELEHRIEGDVELAIKTLDNLGYEITEKGGQ